MRSIFRFLSLGLLCILAGQLLADPALARGRSGGVHSGKSKSSSGYIVRHCKTEACFKKHPSGTYSFMPGEHKRKD